MWRNRCDSSTITKSNGLAWAAYAEEFYALQSLHEGQRSSSTLTSEKRKFVYSSLNLRYEIFSIDQLRNHRLTEVRSLLYRGLRGIFSCGSESFEATQLMLQMQSGPLRPPVTVSSLFRCVDSSYRRQRPVITVSYRSIPGHSRCRGRICRTASF